MRLLCLLEPELGGIMNVVGYYVRSISCKFERDCLQKLCRANSYVSE